MAYVNDPNEAKFEQAVKDFVEMLMKEDMVKRNLKTDGYICPGPGNQHAKAIEYSLYGGVIDLCWKSNRAPNAWISDMCQKSGGFILRGYYQPARDGMPAFVVFGFNPPHVQKVWC